MSEDAPRFIPYMPAGVHMIHATINGKPGSARVFVDAAACTRLNADLAALWEAVRRREHARPVLYFDHKQGVAAAFPRRFVWEDERGILLEIAEWTAAGRAAVEGANYGYISPAFRLSREDGQVLGLVPGVEVGSLVNDPAFERIEPIVDSIAAARAPHAPGVDIITSAHCNQQHIPGCPNGSGGGSKWVADPKWSFGEAVQNAFAAENKPKKAYIFKVCEYPDIMKKIAPWEGDVVIRWDNLEKINSRHGLTPEQIATLPQELEKPIAVMEDPERTNEFLIVTDLNAPDRNGNQKKVAAVLRLRKDASGNIEVADIPSAYARDDSGKYETAISSGKLRFLDKERAEEWAKLERDRVSKLLTTSQASPGSGDIKAQQAEEVKGENAPYDIFSALLTKALHCNQQHIPGCPNGSGGGGAQLAQDTTGLQAHLNDEVHPVEINFTPEKQNLKQLLKEGKLRYLDKNRAMEWARLEEDNLPLLLPTSQATHGSSDIKAQQAEGVKGENAPRKGMW